MMSEIKSYLVGRGSDCPICIIDNTVSRRHCEVTIARDGRLLLTDCGSLNGIHIAKGNTWQKLTQDYVSPDHGLRIGSYETTAARLLKMLSSSRQLEPEPVNPEKVPLPKGKLQRDPMTGDVIPSNK